MSVRLTVHHHITDITIVIAELVLSRECTLLQQHPMPYRDRAWLSPSVPPLLIGIGRYQQRLFGNRLGTTNQVRLQFDEDSVPVEYRVVDQVIHRKHWLPTKHKSIWRDTSDIMWYSDVNHHQVRQRLRPLPPLGLTK